MVNWVENKAFFGSRFRITFSDHVFGSRLYVVRIRILRFVARPGLVLIIPSIPKVIANIIYKTVHWPIFLVELAATNRATQSESRQNIRNKRRPTNVKSRSPNLQCVQKFCFGSEIWPFLGFFSEILGQKIDFSKLPYKTGPKGEPERRVGKYIESICQIVTLLEKF